jgi:hypothetical protein
MAPAPLPEAMSWIATTRTSQPLVHRFRWRFQDQVGSAGGRGSARITPGDSLRFDVIGPLGSGRGAAFVVGDSAHWAQPEDEVRKLVPNYPLLWAMLGVARLPMPLEAVSRAEEPRVTAWRFVAGADTTEYAWIAESEPRLVAEVRRGGERVGRVVTVFSADGRPRSARLLVPSGPARLDISYVATTTVDGFPPDTWLPPAP